MIRKSAGACAVLAVSAALLIDGGGSAAAVSSASSIALRPQSLPPQESIPDLEAPGTAQTVTYPSDGQWYYGPSTVNVKAPEHTLIEDLDLNCGGQSCPVNIAKNRRSATGIIPGVRWNFIRPLHVSVIADPNASPAGGLVSGTFTLRGVVQPLTVRITLNTPDAPGTPGTAPDTPVTPSTPDMTPDTSGTPSTPGTAPGTAPVTPSTPGTVEARLKNATPRGSGVEVVNVDLGTRTQASGLQRGDIITQVGGTPIRTVNDLEGALPDSRATYPMTVKRGGTSAVLQFTPDS